MASRWTSAAKGAAAGASTGSALGGFGTLAGAGLGAIAGGIAGGPSEAQLLEEKRMAELMRRQELGTLGYTDQEMQVVLGEAQGARIQQQQAQRAQQAGLMASQDLGAGAVFRAQQEEASLKRKEMEFDRQKALEKHLDEKRLQEAEITTLAGLAEKRQELEREAMISSLIDVSGQITGAGIDFFKAEETARKAEAMAKKEDDAAVARLKEQRGGQDAAAVKAQQSIYDNKPPVAVAPAAVAPAAVAPAALDRFDILALKEAGALSPAATGVSPELIQRAQELNMPLQDYLLFLRSIGRGV